ncbi:MAG: hydroxymethylglutaryl-CoA lyase [Acidimicrobiaceae bacterium]|nr:hydroxymethylglutaryl-CoA lyase [Acidimicrobiaceae bacterium]
MIDIREVGPRDGLQVESPLTVEQRIEFIQCLIAAGVNHIEIASFMRDDLVPSMAGAEQVVAGVPARAGLTRTGLVANTKGAKRALACGLDEVTITVSLSETYSQKNTGKSRREALTTTGEILNCIDAKIPTDVVISCAFGSPYADVSMQHDLLKFVDEFRGLGCDRITLADTTGEATPRLIREALALVGTDVGLHLHETRGTGLVNAIAGLEAGVRRFDCSLGGIGGSPFANGAAGNVATETLVFLLHDLGYQTSIDLDKLLAVAPLLSQMIGHRLPSALAHLH